MPNYKVSKLQKFTAISKRNGVLNNNLYVSTSTLINAPGTYLNSKGADVDRSVTETERLYSNKRLESLNSNMKI